LWLTSASRQSGLAVKSSGVSAKAEGTQGHPQWGEGGPAWDREETATSDGKWSGGAVNRKWTRPGSRLRLVNPERDARLYELMKHERFLCEACGQMHELIEHQACRELEAARPNPGR